MRSILVGEVRTGRRITQIPVSSASWSMQHRAPGEITVDIPLGAQDFARLERELVGLYPSGGLFMPFFPTPETPVWVPGDGLIPEFLTAIEPGRCFMAVVEDDEVLEAGPIWSWDFDYATTNLTVKAAGLWSLLDHRFVVGELTSAWAAWAATYSGLSLGTIAKRVVQLAETLTGGDLPIVLPADEAGDHARTYKGYDLASVRERITELMGVEDGPDIAFQPRLTADRLGIEWVMRTGTVADPMLHQVGGDWVWDARVPRGGVSGISVRRDASALASRSYATGAGMETALLMARRDDAVLTDAGFPLLEVKESRSTVKDQATLNRWAAANLSASSRPWQTWECTVRADVEPKLGTYRPGDLVKIWTPTDHPLLSNLLPAGYHRTRILNVSGDMSNEVKLVMAPLIESR